ncbi:F0F1 ATP synthase subunit B' [Amaricoccus tamworthensis]|uniref:F0F1 ATP synthase subunit B' n=1 Tax=Amaricoccus tamworthensis TaxID=57002 RepID=UPI003C7CAFDE
MANTTEAADHLGNEVLHEAEAGMPQLDPNIFPNLIFWLVVSIVLLYLILTKVALPRLNSVLAERSDAISNDLEQAQLFKKRAEDAEAAYNASLAKAREEAQQIAADTKAEINRELGVLLEKADAEIAAKSAESERRIAEIQESAAKSVEDVAKETAAEIVASFLPGGADQAAVDSAVSERVKG